MGILFWGKTVDIFMHDAYLVVMGQWFGVVSALLMGLLGFGYWLVLRLNGRPLPVLSAVHLLLTIGALMIMLVLIALQKFFVYGFTGVYGLGYWMTVNDFILMAMVGLVVSQMIYLINLLFALITR